MSILKSFVSLFPEPLTLVDDTPDGAIETKQLGHWEKSQLLIQ